MNQRLFFVFVQKPNIARTTLFFVAYIEHRFIFFELTSLLKISTIRASPS